jgi:hypothetical protein
MSSRGRVFITAVYEMEVSLEDIFVDDNMPENPEYEDVEKLIEEYGGWPHVVNEWNFDEPIVNISVQVSS